MKDILNDMLTLYPVLEDLPIERALYLLLDGVRRGGKILTCGNGVSAADAEHIVGELMKGFRLRRALSPEEREAFCAAGERGEYIAAHLQKGIPAISLNSQVALMTAIGNDTACDMIFAQQVYAYAGENDVLIALTTSGNSRNVVLAALTAKAVGAKVIGITGSNPGALGALSDVCLAMPSPDTYRVQELTLPVYHALCATLEAALFTDTEKE
jgi:phosphoheptose isomerase